MHPLALRISGDRFLSLCANPPPDRGAEVFAMCQMYVAGIADALETTGLACFGPRVTQGKLLASSMWWLQSRPRGTFPAGLMIKNGLVKAFPCRTTMRAMARPQPDQSLERFEKLVRFLTPTKALLALFG